MIREYARLKNNISVSGTLSRAAFCVSHFFFLPGTLKITRTHQGLGGDRDKAVIIRLGPIRREILRQDLKTLTLCRHLWRHLGSPGEERGSACGWMCVREHVCVWEKRKVGAREMWTLPYRQSVAAVSLQSSASAASSLQVGCSLKQTLRSQRSRAAPPSRSDLMPCFRLPIDGRLQS